MISPVTWHLVTVPDPAPPPTPELAFLMAFWDAWQALASRGDVQLRERHGLDLRAFIALAYVQGSPMQPAGLAREVGVPPYEISRILAALESRGAVTREHDGPDARRVTVTVTPAGRELWAQALGTAQAVIEPPLASLGPSLARMTQTLNIVAQAARQEPSP